MVDPTKLVVAHWDGSRWEDYGNGRTTGTAAAGTVTTGGEASSFSPFAVGSSTSINPLPVEFISFKAVVQQGQVHLNWSTATELNNKGFWVERSGDGVTFKQLAFVEGGKTSHSMQRYTHVDFSPLPNTAYYCLKQVDFDGSEAYSKIVAVQLQEATAFVAVPNPVSDRVTLSWSYKGMAPCEVTVSDARGRILYKKLVNQEEGRSSLVIDMSRYANGFYIATVKGTDGTLYRQKLIKE